MFKRMLQMMLLSTSLVACTSICYLVYSKFTNSSEPIPSSSPPLTDSQTPPVSVEQHDPKKSVDKQSAQPSSSSNTASMEFSNDDAKQTGTVPVLYPYRLGRGQIEEAIQYGKTQTLNDKFFHLPLVSSSMSDVNYVINNAAIITPFSSIADDSALEYIKNDRTPLSQEMHKWIDYQTQRFTIQFHSRNQPQFYAVELTQGNRVLESTRVDNGDTFKIVNYESAIVNYTEPAFLKVFAKDSPSDYAVFEIRFDKYVR